MQVNADAALGRDSQTSGCDPLSTKLNPRGSEKDLEMRIDENHA